MELKRYFRFILAVLVTVGLFWALALSYQTVREQEGSFSALLESYVLTAIAGYLLFFLVLLVIRYGVLIMYSFFDHIESLYKKRAYTPPRLSEERSLPMVTIVVPAFNEGVVIQPALRALIDLDYPNYEVIVVDDGSTDDTYEKAMIVARESLEVSIRVVTKKCR